MGGELRRLPRPDTCRILEHLLGAPAQDLIAPVPDGSDLSPAARPAAPVSGNSGQDDNPAVIIARDLSSGNTDAAVLSFVGAQLQEVTDHYEREGPIALRGQARTLRQLGRTLLAGQQPPSARRELFRLTARAAGLLGYMAVNTGDFPLAEAYCTEALELGRAAGDPETELWAGWKYSITDTNITKLWGIPGSHQVQWIDALHRHHAVVEDRVRTNKATGLRNLPAKSWTVNRGWMLAANVAADLDAWLRLLTLHDQDDLSDAEPQTMRMRIYHQAGRLAHHAPIRRLRLDASWPWATAFALAWNRLTSLPRTT